MQHVNEVNAADSLVLFLCGVTDHMQYMYCVRRHVSYGIKYHLIQCFLIWAIVHGHSHVRHP